MSGAQCHFYILNRDDPENSHSLWVRNRGGGSLVLDEPPAVGDLIALAGETRDPEDETGENEIEVTGVWRVLARCWSPAAFGSQAWLTGDRQTVPAWLDVMLERSDGIFSDSHYRETTNSPAANPKADGGARGAGGSLGAG